jgi:transcriptional regulator NrdR family protein
MANTKTKQNLIHRFTHEVSVSLLLSRRTKDLWLSKADKLPFEVLKLTYRHIKKDNDKIRRYLIEAVKAKPDSLNKINQKIKKVEREVMRLEEQDSKPNADEQLEKQIKEL